MDVGKGCIISDIWIPKGIDTGLLDYEGKPIITADKVMLTGCSSRFAIVGKNMNGEFVLYFGSEHGSVSWYLSERNIVKHKVKVTN